MKTSFILALALGTGSLVACGGGDGGGSGVSSSKDLTEISDSEVIKLCEWSNSLNGDTSKDLNCKIEGVIVGEGDEATCTTTYESCLEEPDEDPEDCSDAPSELENLPECASEITIGDFEKCALAQRDLLEEVNADFDCTSSQEDLDRLGEDVPACVALSEKCPELFGEVERVAPETVYSTLFPTRNALR